MLSARSRYLPAWRKFLAQFQDVLVILLLVATAISAGLWIYERESALPYEALAIFTVVLLNVAYDFTASWRASVCAAASSGRQRNRASKATRLGVGGRSVSHLTFLSSEFKMSPFVQPAMRAA